MYEELDRRLVNVLQIDPRASWAKVGKILGVSPTTVAHRWQRLVDDGIAWITACPNLNQQMTAIVEVDCHTESLPQVIKTLCANPMIVSVDETTGDRDLLLTVVAPDLPTLSDMVIDWIGGLRGVHGSHSALVTSVVIDSDSWRIDALSKTEKTLARGPDQESCGCYLPTTWTGSWLGCLLSMDVLAPPHLLVLSTSPLALCIAGCRSC
ncbi:Lrp/AsnC family transcriptional regulator [Cutibacterium modestum]|uniref:Lrp/AsnC family transcriptional regulator n=1 Tax=Cutibacterium modestum TaxID=2559073 RepID=UPI000F051565|nr:Lrp/AsnC family transcriptional regulator [Cutibacterium modestum]